ncbi:MAG: phosphoenolpyruvate carboxykinase (ATP) [Planctomycetota bacterium]|nr:MAG: phosphoenolpyruvate carboxykinase (ATP) [Planctomycetota bacterium]
MTDSFDLSAHGISAKHILRNPSPAMLYEEAIRHDLGTTIADSGALIAYSGEKTGRSPKDKRVVRHPQSESNIWWGPVNFPLDEATFMINRERAKDYLNTLDRLYVIDAFAGWDPKYRMKVRVICSRAYHALFMHNMLIPPTDAELADFGEPDFVIYNAGRFPANRYTTGMTSRTSVDLSFELGELVILGTEYAGEMKKGVFTIMNYLMPARRVIDPVRPVGNRQDDALRRPEPAAHRRRRTLLERRRHLQRRRRLLRQGNLPVA